MIVEVLCVIQTVQIEPSEKPLGPTAYQLAAFHGCENDDQIAEPEGRMRTGEFALPLNRRDHLFGTDSYEPP